MCTHAFCELCIKQFIVEHKRAQELICPHPSCGKIIKLVDLTSLLSIEELKEHFLHQKVEFLSSNTDRFKQCPTPDCENVLCSPEQSESSKPVDYFSKGIVFCDSCGNDYCFKCLKNHYDTDCNMNKIITDDIPRDMNVKQCPGCKNLVEKGSGCDYLTCPKCTTKFCFKCSVKFKNSEGDTDIYDHMLTHGDFGIIEENDDNQSPFL